jgi:hypothetical protein
VQYAAIDCWVLSPEGTELYNAIYVVDMQNRKFIEGSWQCNSSGKTKTIYGERQYSTPVDEIENKSEIIDAIWAGGA